MSHLERADLAPHYAAVTLSAPEIADNADKPIWMIQFRGDWPDPKLGESWIDATCIVIGGQPAIYATGPIRDLATGKILRGYYETEPGPDAALPEFRP